MFYFRGKGLFVVTLDLLFFLNAALFGFGLAMDAFSVSLANGLQEPDMKPGRACAVAGCFAGFQTLMPLAGWFLVHTAETLFAAFSKSVPWIALALLLFIGGKMLREGLKNKGGTEAAPAVGAGALLLQGVATSIDALSVGFTTAGLSFLPAALQALVIGAVTFGVCMAGLRLGRRFGTRLAGKAAILGGGILIAIGLEIFIKGVFFG